MLGLQNGFLVCACAAASFASFGKWGSWNIHILRPQTAIGLSLGGSPNFDLIRVRFAHPPSPAQGKALVVSRWLSCVRSVNIGYGMSQRAFQRNASWRWRFPNVPAADEGKRFGELEPSPTRGRWFFAFPRKAKNRMRWKIGDPPGKRRICQISCPLVCRRHNRVPAGGRLRCLIRLAFSAQIWYHMHIYGIYFPSQNQPFQTITEESSDV